MDKIKVWICRDCGGDGELPCVLPYIIGTDGPEKCSWDGSKIEFNFYELTPTELINCYTPIGEHCNFVPMCSKRKGICPDEMTGVCQSFEVKCPEWERIDKKV